MPRKHRAVVSEQESSTLGQSAAELGPLAAVELTVHAQGHIASSDAWYRGELTADAASVASVTKRLGRRSGWSGWSGWSGRHGWWSDVFVVRVRYLGGQEGEEEQHRAAWGGRVEEESAAKRGFLCCGHSRNARAVSVVCHVTGDVSCFRHAKTFHLASRALLCLATRRFDNLETRLLHT